jgi:hypothetical protein
MKRYIVPGHHDRAETRHVTMAAAKRVARELDAEGYPSCVRDTETGETLWTPADDLPRWDGDL